MATTTAKSRLTGRTVTLVGGPKLTKDQVHQAFEKIFRLNGCLACGLLGIDIHIHGGDPDPLVDGLEGFSGIAR